MRNPIICKAAILKELWGYRNHNSENETRDGGRRGGRKFKWADFLIFQSIKIALIKHILSNVDQSSTKRLNILFRGINKTTRRSENNNINKKFGNRGQGRRGDGKEDGHADSLVFSRTEFLLEFLPVGQALLSALPRPQAQLVSGWDWLWEAWATA